MTEMVKTMDRCNWTPEQIGGYEDQRNYTPINAVTVAVQTIFLAMRIGEQLSKLHMSFNTFVSASSNDWSHFVADKFTGSVRGWAPEDWLICAAWVSFYILTWGK